MSLRGKVVVVTRPREQAAAMINDIEERGARAILFPTISILDPDSWSPCDNAIGRLNSYDAMLFTSANGVRGFLGRCGTLSVQSDLLQCKEFYAVGRKTGAEIEARGLKVTHSPEDYSASSLGKVLANVNMVGKRILFPCGNIALRDLPEQLVSMGASVDPIEVYKTSPASNNDVVSIAKELSAGRIDAVTLTSPSAALHLIELMGAENLRKSVVLAVIGPTTAAALHDMGLDPQIIAPVSTTRGLIDALERYFSTG